MTPEEIAERKVKRQKKYYDKLSGNLTAMAVVFVVNYLFTPGLWWSLIPIVVLSIDLVVGYFKTFGFLNRSPDWEYEVYRKELRRLKKLSGELPDEEEDIDKLDLDELKERTKEKQQRWSDEDLV